MSFAAASCERQNGRHALAPNMSHSKYKCQCNTPQARCSQPPCRNPSPTGRRAAAAALQGLRPPCACAFRCCPHCHRRQWRCACQRAVSVAAHWLWAAPGAAALSGGGRAALQRAPAAAASPPVQPRLPQRPPVQSVESGPATAGGRCGSPAPRARAEQHWAPGHGRRRRAGRWGTPAGHRVLETPVNDGCMWRRMSGRSP